MEPNSRSNIIIYSDKSTTFIIQVANQPLTGPRQPKPKDLRIGRRRNVEAFGIIRTITGRKSNKARSGWLLTRLAVQSFFVRLHNKMILRRYLLAMSRVRIRWGLILSKSARTVSSGISQVLQTCTTASTIFSKAWFIMVSCRLYLSVLSSGSGSENSFRSFLKILESSKLPSNWSWNFLGSMSCRILIAPALVTNWFTASFNSSESNLGIEMSGIAAPASGRKKVLRYSATSLYIRSGTKKKCLWTLQENQRSTSARCRDATCWVVIFFELRS